MFAIPTQPPCGSKTGICLSSPCTQPHCGSKHFILYRYDASELRCEVMNGVCTYTGNIFHSWDWMVQLRPVLDSSDLFRSSTWGGGGVGFLFSQNKVYTEFQRSWCGQVNEFLNYSVKKYQLEMQPHFFVSFFIFNRSNWKKNKYFHASRLKVKISLTFAKH